MLTSENWIHRKPTYILTDEKIRTLLKNKDRLVLCQYHELQRMQNKERRPRDLAYIDMLYDDYIIQHKPKTYLQ